MANDFNWGQYISEPEQIEQPPSAEPTQTVVQAPTQTSSPKQSVESSFDWSAYNPQQVQDTPPTFLEKAGEVALESGKGVARTAARTGASLLAAPTKGLGGLLQIAGSAAPVSKFTPYEPLFKVAASVGKFLSETGEGGHNYLKNLIEENLGESYGSGEEALARVGERFADIYGRGPVKGMGIPSLIGGAAGQAGEELGAPEWVQNALEIGGTLGKDVVKGLKYLLPKKVTEKSGLVLPRIVEKTKEGFRLLKPKAFAGKKQKVYNEVSKDAENLINKIKQEKMPLSKAIEEGIDVEGRLSKELSDVEKIAGKLEDKIESKFLSDYLKNTKDKIKSTPVPTEEQDKILKLIEKYEKQYGAIEEGVRFYSPKQYVNQYRNLNKDAKKLYETKLLQGKQKETIGFYEGLKDEITNTIEHGTPKEFGDLFKRTNKEYKQVKDIFSFDNVFSNIIKDGIIDSTKLKNVIKSSTKAEMLQRQLGNDGFNRLKLISDDLVKVKDKLNLVNELDLTSIIKSGATYAILAKLGVPFAKPIQVGKKAADLAYGNMLLKPRGFRDTRNFLNAVNSGNKKAIETTLRRLDKFNQEEEENN